MTPTLNSFTRLPPRMFWKLAMKFFGDCLGFSQGVEQECFAETLAPDGQVGGEAADVRGADRVSGQF